MSSTTNMKNSILNGRLRWRTTARKFTRITDPVRSTLFWCLLVCWSFSNLNLAQSIDHCFTHRYSASINTTHMQFTKEVIPVEYAVLGEFKSLHCCAKGYRSIEWLKDGRPYPWSGNVSSLILYPEASNQTIYTRQVQFADVGNYTCVLRNDTHINVHHITLEVQGNLPDMPLPTFKPRNQVVQLNNPARMYCEAFVGRVSLPDARSEISWYQVFEGGQEQEVDGIQEQVSRENGQIVGSYLIIPSVQLHNYGRYMCRIQIGNAAHRREMYALLFGKPVEAQSDHLLGLIAGISATLAVLLVCCIIVWCSRRMSKNNNRCKTLANSDYNIARRV